MSAYITYITIGTKLILLIKILPVGLTCLYTICYIYINLLRISLIVTFFTPVVNIIKNLLLLIESYPYRPFGTTTVNILYI